MPANDDCELVEPIKLVWNVFFKNKPLKNKHFYSMCLICFSQTTFFKKRPIENDPSGAKQQSIKCPCCYLQKHKFEGPPE